MSASDRIVFDIPGVMAKKAELVSLAARMLITSDIQRLGDMSVNCSGYTYEKLKLINGLLLQSTESVDQIVNHTIAFLSTSLEAIQNVDSAAAQQVAASQRPS